MPQCNIATAIDANVDYATADDDDDDDSDGDVDDAYSYAESVITMYPFPGWPTIVL